MDDARRNAQRSGITNASFICADVGDIVRGWDEATAAMPDTTGTAGTVGTAGIAGTVGTARTAGTVEGTWGKAAAVNSTAVGDRRSQSADAAYVASLPAPVSSLPSLLSLLPPPRPDVIVVGPARAGLSDPVLAFLESAALRGVRRVIYVSCNPATQVGGANIRAG